MTDAPQIDPHTLRRVMSSYPTGVTIVTAGHDDTLAGMAANSFTSVSLTPPIILICSQLEARTCLVAKEARRFAVHICSHDQVAAVRSFVGRDAPRFSAVPHSIDETGTPILDEWLALLVCDLHSTAIVGDHEILFGEVVRCESRDGAPLMFHESALRMLPRMAPLRASGPPTLLSDDDADLYDSLVRVLAPGPGRPAAD